MSNYKLMGMADLSKKLGLDCIPSNIEMFYDASYKTAVALTDYRQEKHLTQKELAAKLSVSQPMVAKIESGDYNFSLETVCDVLSKLDMHFSVSIKASLPLDKENIKNSPSAYYATYEEQMKVSDAA